ncbi:MAG: Hsp20/alpha crystallin family protein [Patescibacteria group bacterium]|jgi:HSP20 family protein
MDEKIAPFVPFENHEEGQLAVDVIEKKESIIIRAAIAGVKPEEIDIDVTNDLVTIRGERKSAETFHDATFHFEECFWGRFSRSIILPHEVNPDTSEAKFKDGILTLTIQKSHGEMHVPIRHDV